MYPSPVIGLRYRTSVDIQIEPEHLMVASVDYVEIALLVHGQARRTVELIGLRALTIATDNDLTFACTRCPSHDSMIVEVRHVDVAQIVDEHAHRA